MARELDLCYATLAVVANAAAGKGDDEISLKEIESNLNRGMGKVRELLHEAIPGVVSRLL